MSFLSGGNGSAQKKQKLSSSPSSSHPGASSQQQQQQVLSQPNNHYHSSLNTYTRISNHNSAATVGTTSRKSGDHMVHAPGSPSNAATPNASSGGFGSGSSNMYINGYAQQTQHGGGNTQSSSPGVHKVRDNYHHSSGSGGRLSNGNIPNGYGPTTSNISHNQQQTSPHSKSSSATNKNEFGGGGGSRMGQQQQHPPQLMPEYPPGNSVSSYDMCIYCFDVLINRLKPDEVPRVTSPSFAHANQSFPLFVTWKSQESPESKSVLRGCIGTFTETKLHKGLHDYALSSALKDSRFPPITEEEITKLVVAVSVLLHFESADGWDDWEIGLHGLRIEIETDRGQKKTATYLPEVASEQRWTKKQTIDSLLLKSGFSGRINSEVRNRIKLTRYKSEKVTLPYSEYRNRKAFKAAQHVQSNNNLKQPSVSSPLTIITNSGGTTRGDDAATSPNLNSRYHLTTNNTGSLISPTSSSANSPMKALTINPKGGNTSPAGSTNWGGGSGGTTAGGSGGGNYRRTSGSSPRRGNNS